MKKTLLLFISLIFFPIDVFAVDYAYKVNNNNYTVSDISNIYSKLTINCTVTILMDINDNVVLKTYGTKSDVIVDLGGHNIKNLYIYGIYNNGAYNSLSDNTAKYEIKNGSVENIEVGNNKTSLASDAIRDEIKLTNVEIKNKLVVYGDAKADLYNCSYNGDQYASSQQTIVDNKGYVNVHSGTYTSAELANNGDMVISGGTYNASKLYNGYLAAHKKAATLTVNGGTFDAKSMTSNTMIHNNNMASTSTKSNSIINITGGTFNAQNEFFLSNSYGTINLENNVNVTSETTLFDNEYGIVNIDGGSFITTTTLKAFSSQGTGPIYINSGTIEAKTANGYTGNVVIVGKEGSTPTATQPVLFLNNTISNPTIRFNSGTIYIGSNDKSLFYVPDNYKVQFEPQSDFSYKAYLTEKTGDEEDDERIIGDFNVNGAFESDDLVLYRKYIAGNSEVVNYFEKTLKPAERLLLDFSSPNDGKIDLVDLVLARLALANQ